MGISLMDKARKKSIGVEQTEIDKIVHGKYSDSAIKNLNKKRIKKTIFTLLLAFLISYKVIYIDAIMPYQISKEIETEITQTIKDYKSEATKIYLDLYKKETNLSSEQILDLIYEQTFTQSGDYEKILKPNIILSKITITCGEDAYKFYLILDDFQFKVLINANYGSLENFLTWSNYTDDNGKPSFDLFIETEENKIREKAINEVNERGRR